MVKDWEEPLQKGIGNDNPAFLPGKSHGQRRMIGYKHRVPKSQTLVKVKTLSCVQHFETPWTIESMGFSRPKYYMLLPI